MAGILEEGPIRRRLRERGIAKGTPIEKGELVSRLMSFMEEYADTLSRSNEMNCDIAARGLARFLDLTSDEYMALRDHCIRRVKGR